MLFFFPALLTAANLQRNRLVERRAFACQTSLTESGVGLAVKSMKPAEVNSNQVGIIVLA